MGRKVLDIITCIYCFVRCCSWVDRLEVVVMVSDLSLMYKIHQGVLCQGTARP